MKMIVNKQIQIEISRFLKGSKARELSPHASLKDDLCLDSLDIVELIVHLEKRYGIEFDGDQMPKIETVDDLTRYTSGLMDSRG